MKIKASQIRLALECCSIRDSHKKQIEEYFIFGYKPKSNFLIGILSGNLDLSRRTYFEEGIENPRDYIKFMSRFMPHTMYGSKKKYDKRLKGRPLL